MSSLFAGIKSGFKSYFTNSTISNLRGIMKSKFGCDNEYNHDNGYSSNEVQTAFMVSNLSIFILIIVSIVLGFIAVNKICKDPSERGKNTRLGLYAILILTGGQVGWIYILLWIMKFDICV
jgi:hypothetical protein